MDKSKEEILKISMLGGLKLDYGEYSLTADSSRTKQVWSLLEYLICHRSVEISVDKFIEVLWSGEKIENPSNALKNLVYRLRNLLKVVGRCEKREYIVFKRGTYGWNNQIPCIIDLEEMERLIHQGNNKVLETSVRADYYIQALQLYRGEFLPSGVYDEWSISIRTYYRNLYIDCVEKLCVILSGMRRYQEIEAVCTRALAMEPFEEDIHENLLRALVKLNKHNEALAHYNYVAELFYKELGVKISPKIRNLYREILKCLKNVETDVAIITEELQEQNRIEGAFLCEHEIFKSVYRIMARSVARSGQHVFIGLLTLTDQHGDIPNEEMREQAMDALREACIHSLRKGDVVSRFSATQYMVLIPTSDEAKGQVVMERICASFYSRYGKQSALRVHAKLFPIDAIE